MKEKQEKGRRMKKLLVILMIVIAVAMVGWKIGYKYVHEHDCCSELSSQEKERKKRCEEEKTKEGKTPAEASIWCSPMVLTVCSECERPWYDNLIWGLVGMEGVFTVAFVVVCLKDR